METATPRRPVSAPTTTMKVIETLVFTAIYAFISYVLGAEWTYYVIAFGGSFSGSIVLAYFRREPQVWEAALKIGCSTICGIIGGSVAQEYLQVLNPKYIVGLFFLCSLISLVILKALLSLTERNAGDICQRIIVRIFNVQLKDDKERQQTRRRQRRMTEQHRFVTVDDTQNPHKPEKETKP
jgi:hypothetical protein